MAIKSVCACWFLKPLTADVVLVVLVKVARRLVDDAVEVAIRAVRAGEPVNGYGCHWRAGQALADLVASETSGGFSKPAREDAASVSSPGGCSTSRQALGGIGWTSPSRIVRSTCTQQQLDDNKESTQNTRSTLTKQAAGTRALRFQPSPFRSGKAPRTGRRGSGSPREKQHEGNQTR